MSSFIKSPNITPQQPIYQFYKLKMAICHFRSSNGLVDNGYAILSEYPNKTVITLNLFNLPPGNHGFHIHEYADMREGCMSLGSHYNPFNGIHGALNQTGNHLGDLGNIYVNESGRCNYEIVVNYLPLSGKFSVIGRSMVVHSGIDDLGSGHDDESKKTGNSGGRISCGIIGYLN
ncbi:Cu/Zn superoxide dismutase [Tupanvirus soda lake]|uniref:Cu/Zn superoxide dismutase n=2 Tax=Tupanvirus TaxID=2094720 RepID=A0A6N1NWQ5_9VIRU|nr:Cu/Zn superoxide dismutase [Tupanvirus soda lake]QKU35756.1 Cu/Zn superoxide dismutase [Tupanvirus soda lake]